MIAISSEKICFLVVKLRQIQAQVAGDDDADSGSNPSDDHFVEVLEDDEDTTRTEIADFIAGLNTEETANLIALLWLGRGDADIEDWDRLVADAAEAQTTPAAEYLMTTPLAADYLEDGLGQHGHSCEEFEAGRL